MIALLSDFQDSEYAGTVRGVIYSIAPEAKVADITHRIRPFDIRQGAYAIYSAYKFFPDSTIFLAVVDPGVGTEREGVIIKSKINRRAYCFVGPNNGIFSLIEAERVYRIKEKKVKEHAAALKYTITNISKTFHARDIFGPTAAMLELGAEPEQFGEEISKKRIKQIIKNGAKITNGTIEGEVVCHDGFGNIITSIKGEHVNKMGIRCGKKIEIMLNKNKLKLRFLETYGHAMKDEIFCLINSAEHLEIAVNCGSAQKILKAAGGERISVST